MTLYAFDRDDTVDVNQGPVPLDWVIQLAESEHEVWAIGNQALKAEANIPGTAEALAGLGLNPESTPSRRQRLGLLVDLFPSVDEFVVVDDVDLSDVEGWTYYTPEDFFRKLYFEEGFEIEGFRFITDRIAMGNSSSARNPKQLSALGITAVLNVAFDLDLEGPNVYKQGLIAGPGNSITDLDQAVGILDWLLSFHEKVSVHCHDAVDRSPLVIAAHFALKGRSLDEAFEAVGVDMEARNPALSILVRKWLDSKSSLKMKNGERKTENGKRISDLLLPTSASARFERSKYSLSFGLLSSIRLPTSDMRALMIHPQGMYNIGDRSTFLGSEHLLKKAFGCIELVEFDMRRAEAEIDTYVPQYNWGDIDLIVIPGAPWLGTRLAPKHVMLQQACSRWPDALKIGLGVGSFFSHMRMHDADKYICSDITKDVAELFREFDLIVTRDILAHKLLIHHGIPNQLFFDTSIFAYFSLLSDSYYTPDSNAILVFSDPGSHEQKDHLPPQHWKSVQDLQTSWAKTNQARVFCISSQDKAAADELGLECRFVSDIQWVASQLSSASKVLTPRVHQAILAVIAGCQDASLIPVDSRYLTALPLGLKIVQPQSEYKFQLGLNGEENDFNLLKLRDGTYADFIVKLLLSATKKE